MSEHRNLAYSHAVLFWLLCFSSIPGIAQTAPRASAAVGRSSKKVAVAAAAALPTVCAVCIRAHMDFLAADAQRGRGSGTPDEWVAATYVGAEMEQYGIAPAGDDGSYIQRGVILQPKLKAAPVLRFGASGAETSWSYGQDFEFDYFPKLTFNGPLQRVDTDAQPDPNKLKIGKGAVVLLVGKDREKLRGMTFAVMNAGASAILRVAGGDQKLWEQKAQVWPKPPRQLEGAAAGLGSDDFCDLIVLSDAAFLRLKDIADGTRFTLDSEVGETEKSYTWNAVGKIEGRDPALRSSVVLLSAHLDHLGVGREVNGDSIYNGADDDASGTTVVIELARTLALGPHPRRTVIFALFGSEEAGGLGSTWFQLHPPVPLEHFAANLEFEMIGRPDPKYSRDTLWLTGWERSNLGPALAAHGAKLEADKRPEEKFFMRSDNFVLAKKGIVAQTVSSFGLHKDYHQPSDDLAHIDFQHMNAAIGSMIGPVEWLVNSSFTPKWNAGGKP